MDVPETNDQTSTLLVRTAAVTEVLTALTVVLVSVSLVGGMVRLYFTDVDGLLWKLDVGTDASLPTWFSAGTLGLCGVLAALHGTLAKRRNESNWTGWYALAVLFTAFSIDDVAMFHEWSTAIIVLNPGDRLVFAWAGLGAVIVVALAIVFGPFLWRLPTLLRRRLLQAATVFFLGAIVIETVNGYLLDAGRPLAYLIGTAVEEAAEMLGAVMSVHALLAALPATRISLGANLGGGRDTGTTPRSD